ncbi:helix-turn-helix domain-containing protein [Ralstonia solanacearum P673]|uniref:helix-turn-helix domain-containing protein n=1 Tax=Ralstonia solanacearum TaxID=305 RepID=UPI002029EC7F|nr:helix-turn-helix domain-containing protein [Ralstonia solanacearum]MCL9847594.1 helix-turn-helix domain-containing protein [Ralstonia solanacearum]MCL9853632.1 helix-turn-helix domain-containing protein [Ralstonia solanacearum]MCL9861474.1 helix-turn-helix domain-containing protein [Ralstonia solanacearum]MCL9863634.1 helix-turn-helix domain-containing protein [Ralstonia solanacearum]MCL9868078.1 helix-turn-helix domain-containing protein [Ralstonia solanacearum]
MNTNHVTAHLTLPDFHEVALRIGIRGDTADRRKPLRLRDAGTLAVAKPIADGAGNALMAWPKGFYCLLDTIRERRAYAVDWRIRNAMGPIYQDIYRHLNDARFDFIRQAFEGYVHDRWEAPLARRNRNLGPQIVRGHQWVPVPDAARKVGVDPSLLRRMGVHHEIPTRELVTDSGRLARVINLSAAIDSADRLRRAMTLEQAASQLEISDNRVRQLLTAGLLVALGGPPRAGERWWIDLASIEQCSRCGRRVITKNEHSVSVAHIAKYQISEAKQFVAMILAIQSGQLSVWVPPQARQQIGSWLLNEEEVANWRSQEQEKRPVRLSINDVALQLGVKQEVAYALVRSGILPAVVEKIGRRAAQWVNASALHQFRKRYVLGNELARLSGTSPKQIAQRLRISGILPVAGPTSASAPCRQYIWKRTRNILALAAAKKPHGRDKP